MFNTHICNNCFESYSGKPELCPYCGRPTKYYKGETTQKEENGAEEYSEENKPVKEKPVKQKKKRITDKEIMDAIPFESLVAKTNDNSVRSWREKNKKKNKSDVIVQENGEYEVDTSDVSYLPETYNYSAKKARGEYKRPKIKWWEIYKWADLLLARRKVKKQVNKASQYKPEVFSKTVTLILCVLFGWMGAHNFYVRNRKKGFVSLFSFFFGAFIAVNPATRMIQVSIGGLFLFIAIFIWLMDLINLITNTFSYRLSKWRFIDGLNTETRAKLGYKYVDKDEYKRLWIVRVCHSIKRNAQERKEEKAQRKAEQEKAANEQKDDAQAIEETQNAEINEQKIENKPTKNNKNVKNNNKKGKKIKIKKK